MACDNKPIVLIVDDEKAILASMTQVLGDEGFCVETTDNPTTVIELIGTLVPDIVFLDIFMPNSDGIKLLGLIKKEFPAQKIIIISGHGNIPLAIDALKNGALDFIEKPFSLDTLLEKIATYCTPSLEGSLSHDHVPRFTHLVGESYLFKELMGYVHRITPLSNHTIIYGPRGIGKTTLALYMHEQKNTPLPHTIISCSKDPDLSCHDTLFGERGSIILQHIEALSHNAQKRLLAFAENSSTLARIFCLSDKNLFSLVQKNEFNADLFFRISSTPIEIPSLNKRRFDIPLLVHHFLTLINTQTGNKSFSCTPDATRLLRNHEWKEHCRELLTLLTTVVHTMPKEESIIHAHHLAQYIHESETTFVEEQRFRGFNSLDEATLSFQKKFLLYQLKKNRYDLDQVSNILNISVPDLENEMQRLRISLNM